MRKNSACPYRGMPVEHRLGGGVTSRLCTIEGCDRALIARGWCSMHYQRWKNHGDPEAPGRERRYCTVEECERPRFGHWYCQLHYDRWREHGNPLTSKLNRQHDGVCSIEGCDRPYKGHNLCHLHLRRLRSNGTTDAKPQREPPQCSIEGCTKVAHGKGLCRTHYARLRKHGTTDKPEPPPAAACSVDACSSLMIARGLCVRHYQKWQKYGDPLAGITVRSGRGLTCEVDGCSEPYKSNGMCTRHALRDYTRRNRDKVRAWRQRRGARLKAGSPEDRAATIQYRSIIIEDPCVYCGAPSRSVDHIQPVADGGADSWENMAPTCRSCNSSKQAKDLLQFLVYRARKLPSSDPLGARVT